MKKWKNLFASMILKREIRYLMRLSISAFLIGVKNGRYTSEHLHDERFPIHQIKLLHRIFDGRCHQFIGLMQRIDLKERRHDHEVPGCGSYRLIYRPALHHSMDLPISGENIFEIKGGINERGHHVSHDAGV